MRMPEHGARSANGEDSDARRDVLSEQSEVLLDDDRRGSGVAADSDELWEEREGRNALRHVVGLGEMQDVTEVEYRKVRLERVVLVGVWSSAVTTQAQAEESLRELAALAETAGAEVCDGLLQHRYRPDAATYVGSGKAKEIAGIVAREEADTIIVDDDLPPSQRRALEDVTKVKVVDRTAVILDIFAQHATSREGKAQVELAQLQYMLPRLRGWGASLSRQAGGRAAGADGAHTSIPAPGLGALAAGLGGRDSKLAKDLAALGVTADDIAVVSKHDTSTNANDPNESELHNTLAHAIGRADGNPLFVISQKTVTGHAKGGACIFQVNGLTQLFKSGVIPANAALDCVDPKLERDDHMVWLTKPLHVGKVKAGLVTSLGFGHVSGFGAIVNPGAFEAAVAHTAGIEALEEWRRRANERLAAGQRRLEEGMMGHEALYEPIDNRRFHETGRGYDAHEVEKAMLLDPDARLGESGYYEV